MSREQWRPFKHGHKWNEPEDVFQEHPDLKQSEAYSWIKVAQLGGAQEMVEHLEYVMNNKESPYYYLDPEDPEAYTSAKERRDIAPLIWKFMLFVKNTHPNVAENQLVESVRAAMYDPGVLDLVRFIDQMDSANIAATSNKDSEVVLPWFERGLFSVEGE